MLEYSRDNLSISYGAPHPPAMFERGGRKIRQQSVPSRKFSQGEEDGSADPLQKTFVGDIVCSMIIFLMMDFYSLSYPRNGRRRSCVHCFDPWDAEAKRGLQQEWQGDI
jgi:hypothetical protein